VEHLRSLGDHDRAETIFKKATELVFKEIAILYGLLNPRDPFAKELLHFLERHGTTMTGETLGILLMETGRRIGTNLRLDVRYSPIAQKINETSPQDLGKLTNDPKYGPFVKRYLESDDLFYQEELVEDRAIPPGYLDGLIKK